MNILILYWALNISLLFLGLAMALSTLRVVRGPRAQDRVLGLDTLYSNAMLFVLTLGIRYGTNHYFEAALVIALVGFVATTALAKFLMRGEVIE